MGDIVKGIIAGGWGLLVGWLAPTAVNVALFRFLVAPQINAQPIGSVLVLKPAQQSLAFLAASAVLGLLFAASQTQLYRLLEGYVGWRPPSPAAARRRLRAPMNTFLAWLQTRALERKQTLLGRLDLVELSQLESAGRLREELRERLAEVRADSRLVRWMSRDESRNLAQLALLREKLRRYPVDDAQVVPTRLGNAIRRLEEYSYDRYRLDSQLLWYELNAVAPEHARKQTEQARTTVDFLVCLLYGHLLVALTGIVALLCGVDHPAILVSVVAVLGTASWAWYRVAIVATDDWAAAARALVNLGRKPLADLLGLEIPSSLSDERKMWSAVSRLSARPFDSRSAELDPYRAASRDDSGSPDSATRASSSDPAG